ncbi:unnamed protein product, partial [Prorocentrum cordatum]
PSRAVERGARERLLLLRGLPRPGEARRAPRGGPRGRRPAALQPGGARHPERGRAVAHDGSFERRVFSHVLFHPQVIPQAGGETEIADLSAAYASLPQDVRLEWASLASVNAYSGAVHPLVHLHPVSRRPVMFLHLGQTGAVIRWPAESRPAGSAACRDWSSLEAMDPAAGQGLAEAGLRLLNETELVSLLGRYNELLSRSEHHIRYRCSKKKELRKQTVGARRGFLGSAPGPPWRRLQRRSARQGGGGCSAGPGSPRRHPTTEDCAVVFSSRYRPGDLLILDNLAVAHRASQSAHSTAGGTRILHRTTVAGVRPVDAGPSSGLPPFLHIFGATPFQDGGVWQSSDYYGAGFKWNRTLLLRN